LAVFRLEDFLAVFVLVLPVALLLVEEAFELPVYLPRLPLASFWMVAVASLP